MTTTNIINLLLLIVALSAFILSIIELRSYKQKENNKLLSQLNKRYLKNHDIQAVVRYLRVNNPTNETPDAYQIDLFLRFFEELSVYLKSGSLKRKDVLSFFGYYFCRFDKCKRGQDLKSIIKDEDKQLEYLNEYRKLIEPYPKEWLEEDND